MTQAKDSKNDEKNVAAWEMVVKELELQAGINIAEGKVQQFNNRYSTYFTNGSIEPKMAGEFILLLQ